jgi:flagellar assembly factor FliW
VKLKTELFGDLELSEDAVVVFPDGIIGFPQYNKFTIFELPDYQPFFGMQCVDDSQLSFVLVDPRMVIDNYRVVLSDLDIQELGGINIEELAVFAFVVLHSDPKNVTANLQGPIVINPAAKIGKQIIMANEQYQLKHHLYADASSKAV